MKTIYLGVTLILEVDKETGFLEGVQVPDSYQCIMDILSCDALKHCHEVANKEYMDRNLEAYR